MAFKLNHLRTGDFVFVIGTRVNELCPDARQIDNPSETYVRFIAMEGSGSGMYLMNPDFGSIPISMFRLKDHITAVIRNEEVLFPKASLSSKERAFLSNLKPLLKKDTLIVKVSVCGGHAEFLKLINVKGASNNIECIDLPYFLTGAHYRGLAAGEKFTAEDLGLPTSEDE